MKKRYYLKEKKSIDELLENINKSIKGSVFHSYQIEGNNIFITTDKEIDFILDTFIINLDRLNDINLVNICNSKLIKTDNSGDLKLYTTEIKEYDKENEFNPDLIFHKIIIHLGYENEKEEILFVYEIDKYNKEIK